MLLFGYTEDGELLLLHEFFRLGVPPGHVLAAARSPGGEEVQEYLLPMIALDRETVLPINGGQLKCRKRLTDLPGGR